MPVSDLSIRSSPRLESTSDLVSVLLKLLLRLVVDASSLLRINEHLARCLLALIVRLALDFPPLLESAQNTLANSTPHSRQASPAATGVQCSTGHEITYLATTSRYFHPNSCPNLPTVQYFLPGFNRSTRSACGTTMRFLWSYGGGTPSKVFRRSIALAPRSVLCGIMPRTVRQNIFAGVR